MIKFENLAPIVTLYLEIHHYTIMYDDWKRFSKDWNSVQTSRRVTRVKNRIRSLETAL